MSSYVRQSRRDRVIDIPVSTPQLELRRGSVLRLASVSLQPNEVLVLRALTLTVLAQLNPENVSDTLNTPQGLCSVGVYSGSMVSTPLALISTPAAGTVSMNPFRERKLVNPGLYTVILVNNTGRTVSQSADISVCVTGTLKLYLA